MIKEEMTEMLKRSVDEWNQSDLSEADLVGAELQGADLFKANLQGADLTGAKLQNADLVGTNLQNADLVRASLQGANLTGAKLQGADLANANLQDAILTNANLQDADLNTANLQGANLTGAKLQGADLTNANLQDADLNNANLQDADLTNANLQDTDLTNANLQGADLRSTKSYILSSTFTRGTRFSATATDPWSILRRKYTGPAMLWTVLALIAACVPYVAKVLYWSAMNRSQASSAAQPNCGVPDCIDYTVIELVFGFDKGAAYWLIPVTLVTYNAIRGFLTWKVAPMRDEEERSGYSPSWVGRRFWHGYKPLYRLHLMAQTLFYLATVVFGFNAWYWLSQSVWVPAG